MIQKTSGGATYSGRGSQFAGAGGASGPGYTENSHSCAYMALNLGAS